MNEWLTSTPCPLCGCPMEDWSSETEYDYRCHQCGVAVQGEHAP